MATGKGRTSWGAALWDLEDVCVFSCICLSLFPWNGMGETVWRRSPFLWFSLPHMSMADTDFSCLNFSYKLGVGLFVCHWRFKAWAGLFLPIQLCLSVIFPSACCGVLEEALKGANFLLGGFFCVSWWRFLIWRQVRVRALRARGRCCLWHPAELLLLLPFTWRNARAQQQTDEKPLVRILLFFCQTAATCVIITCVQMP